MRVIEPRQMARGGRRKRRSGAPLIWAIFFVVALGAGYGLIRLGHTADSGTTAEPNANQNQSTTQAVTQVKKEKTVPIQFSGTAFRDLYRNVMHSYPNTQAFSSPPIIMGDDTADAHIRRLAEARGFMETRMPVSALIKLNEPLVSGEKDDLLQPAAEKAWQELKQTAKSDNIPLALLSAYRSPEFQRTVFLDRLASNGASTKDILNLKADTQIDATLGRVAVPGYSRHHTGYTIDLWCEDGSGNFESSSCFEWIKANNYLVAKQSGWIPSYPDGAEDQGPEPEAWEYVWVGRDVLFE